MSVDSLAVSREVTVTNLEVKENVIKKKDVKRSIIEIRLKPKDLSSEIKSR